MTANYKKIIMLSVLFIGILCADDAVKKDRKYTYDTEQNLLRDGIIDSIFFTPDQAYDIKCILLALIESEKTMIKAALFRLTDQDITQALISAHKRGVAIELVVDTGALDKKYYSKISALEAYDIPVFVYQPIALLHSNKPTRFPYQSIMHHKTFLFFNTIGGSVVVCGSLNPTYAAFHGNEECVTIRNQAFFFARWQDHFERLKKRCNLYTKSIFNEFSGMIHALQW